MNTRIRSVILIAHNLRSCHNVGSLLRTADGLGIAEVILSGYTPYPQHPLALHRAGKHTQDDRLPHEAAKLHRQIQKTSLGAELTQAWRYEPDVATVIKRLHAEGYTIAAIEQAAGSTPLPHYQPPDKIALLVGREVEGVEPEVLAQMDTILEIPMFGKKESFNVVQAAAMALYHCHFYPFLQ